MSSLLNKLKGHGHHDQAGTYPSENTNQPSSKAGYDNTQSGYGDNASLSQRDETNHGNTPNTSSGYDNGPLNSHSDGGKYHAPKGTHVGQGHNPETVGPHNSNLINNLDPKVNSDQSKLHKNTHNGYGEPGYNQSDYNSKQPGYDNSRSRYGNDRAGYGTTTTTTTNTSTVDGHDQYGTTHGNTDDPNKRFPEDSSHPTIKEKLDPHYDTNSSQIQRKHDNLEYGNTASAATGPHSSSTNPRYHGNNNQYATGAAGTYGSPESSRHHNHPVRNDDTIMNRSHPVTSMHPSDRRYDASRADQTTGPDGEYLPGPAPNTAGPHKSDLLNKLDPRVDSDQSKLEKEREREGYGTDSRHHMTESGYRGSGNSGTTYSSEHERRINEGHHDRRHEGTGTGIGQTDHQYSSNSPTNSRDSGYGGQGSTMSNFTHRKPVNEHGTYSNDQYNSGNDYDRSNPASTYKNAAATSQNTYGNHNDENDFECAKCGHNNTHLRKNKTDQYGNKPNLMDKINPRTDATGNGQAGFMK